MVQGPVGCEYMYTFELSTWLMQHGHWTRLHQFSDLLLFKVCQDVHVVKTNALQLGQQAQAL